jgi:hypothetical protein
MCYVDQLSLHIGANSSVDIYIHIYISMLHIITIWHRQLRRRTTHNWVKRNLNPFFYSPHLCFYGFTDNFLLYFCKEIILLSLCMRILCCEFRALYITNSQPLDQQNEQYCILDIYITISHKVLLHVSIPSKLTKVIPYKTKLATVHSRYDITEFNS